MPEVKTFVVAALPAADYAGADAGRCSRDKCLSGAASRVGAAVSECGANLVLLPPPLASASIDDERDAVEALRGPTFHALSAAARTHGVYVGTSILEADPRNLEVYSAFVLIGPDGQICGRVRNTRPAGTEARFIRPAGNRADGDGHVIPTKHGNVAVGFGLESRASILVDELDGEEEDAALIVHVDAPIIGRGIAAEYLENTSVSAAEAMAREYQCPVVSMGGANVRIIGPDGEIMDEAEHVSYGEDDDEFAQATVPSRVPSGSNHTHCQFHGWHWNTLLNDPPASVRIHLRLAGTFWSLYYGISVRRRIRAGRALSLDYDPHPLLSCYAASILLIIAFIMWRMADEYHTYWGEAYICEKFKSLCHGLCVPFLGMQAGVHGLSHVMHMYVLGDEAGHSHQGRSKHDKISHDYPTLMTAWKVLVPTVDHIGASLERLRAFKKARPYRYLGAVVAVSATLTCVVTLFEKAAAAKASIWREMNLEEGGDTDNDDDGKYAEMLRNLLVPFLVVQALVNASTHALYAFVTSE